MNNAAYRIVDYCKFQSIIIKNGDYKNIFNFYRFIKGGDVVKETT